MSNSEPTDIDFRGRLCWRSWYCVGWAFVLLALAIPAAVLLVANTRLLGTDYHLVRVLAAVVLVGVTAGLSIALGLIVWRIAVGQIDHQEVSASGFQAHFGLWSGFIPWSRVRDVRIARRYFSRRYDIVVDWTTLRGFAVTGVFRTDAGMSLEEAEALMDAVRTRLSSSDDS